MNFDQQLKEKYQFIEKILVEIEHNRELTIDELHDLYGFKKLEAKQKIGGLLVNGNPIINTKEPHILLYVIASGGKIYPCSGVHFDTDSSSVHTRLAFSDNGRTEVVDVNAYLTREEYSRFAEVYEGMNYSLTCEILRNLKNT